MYNVEFFFDLTYLIFLKDSEWDSIMYVTIIKFASVSLMYNFDFRINIFKINFLFSSTIGEIVLFIKIFFK